MCALCPSRTLVLVSTIAGLEQTPTAPPGGHQRSSQPEVSAFLWAQQQSNVKLTAATTVFSICLLVFWKLLHAEVCSQSRWIKICLRVIFITLIIYLESKRKESVHSSFKSITPTTAPLKTKRLIFLISFYFLVFKNTKQEPKSQK